MRRQISGEEQISPPEGSDDAAARAWLETEKAKFKAAADKEYGDLVHGGETVAKFRLTALAVREAGDGSARLLWTLSGYALCFPAGDSGAECDYEASEGVDHGSGERTLTLTGTVRAADLAAALAKAHALRASYGRGWCSPGRTSATRTWSVPMRRRAGTWSKLHHPAAVFGLRARPDPDPGRACAHGAGRAHQRGHAAGQWQGIKSDRYLTKG